MSRNLIIGGLLTALVVLAALLSFVWTPCNRRAGTTCSAPTISGGIFCR